MKPKQRRRGNSLASSHASLNELIEITESEVDEVSGESPITRKLALDLVG
jgi:hypothetical protein